MNTRSLATEMRVARSALMPEHWDELTEHGVPVPLIANYGLVGAAPIRVDKSGLYEPAPDGRLAYITPVRIDNELTPEAEQPLSCARILGHLVDLLAWHPRHPTRWALRTGAATWLGCIGPQYMEPDPVAVRRTPLAWLQAECDGLVILSNEPADAYRLLCGLRQIDAEDAEHATELRRLVRQPWPLPRIAAATASEVRDAA
jgi:hypothetical protein